MPLATRRSLPSAANTRANTNAGVGPHFGKSRACRRRAGILATVHRIAGVTVGLFLAIGAFQGSGALAATTVRAGSITVTPRVGIAGVRLGERQTSVRRSLGKGRLQHPGSYAGYYAYRSGSITVLVSYSAGRVDGVDTRSPSALIYGHPLRRGLAKLRHVLRVHGWRAVTCGGETFTMLGQGGPGTGIAWRAGKLDYVQIDGGASIGDQCLPG
jgi:hypothetical protein